MHPTDQLATAHVISWVNQRLPDPVAGSRDITVQLGRLYETRGPRAAWIDSYNGFVQQLVVPENVLDPLVGMLRTAAIHGFTVAELTADRDLAFSLGFVGE